MQRYSATNLGIAMSVIMFIVSCTKKEIEMPVNPENGSVKLIWNASDRETKTQVETGLKWYLSQLGAMLPKGSEKTGMKWMSEKQLQLNFEELGFSNNALQKLDILASTYRNSEEYRATGGIDMGRWVANTLNNSEHYYEIVDMPQSYSEFLNGNQLASYQGAVHPSSVSFGYRKILFPASNNYKMTFIAEEYTQDFTQSEIPPVEFEVMDVLPNGQIRFGVYENGNLRSGADKRFSAGGKPTKCMWCHESVFLPNFDNSQSFTGYLTAKEFNDTIEHHNQNLSEFRTQLETLLDYSNKKDHVQMELLYIRFFEPSVKRLSSEWQMSEQDVKTRLSGMQTHIHQEFPELGELYYRHEVEPFAPYQSLPSPVEMRETEDNQPQIL